MVGERCFEKKFRRLAFEFAVPLQRQHFECQMGV
jgi:hypothetical protein